MIRAGFHRLFRYSDNCWSLLDETLATIPQTAEMWDTQFETTSQWNSVRMLLAHSIGAEERWITLRLQNRPLPIAYEERSATEWSALYQDHRMIRAATYAYLNSLTDTELEEDKEILRFGSVPVTRADALFHIINHENYHRGQAVMVLQRLGLDPPNFDYVLLK